MEKMLMDLKRRENENEEEFIWRIGQAKDSGQLDLDWDTIAGVINRELGLDDSEYRSGDAYRKPYTQAKRFFEAGVFNNRTSDSYLDELRSAKQEVCIERQKLFDERTALNKMLREQGRMESMYDVVKRAIDDHRAAKFDYSPAPIVESDNDLIIHLTDIHCGVDIRSPFNDFDNDILKLRLWKYLDEIREIQNTYNSQCAYLILGGDMIQGLIHTNARIEAKENVVEQIMNVADLVSGFIYELSRMFSFVEVHSTAGNHSRAMQSKEDTSRGENFDLLIPFACKKDLKDVLNVEFKDNYLACDIATFDVRGHIVYATHGDKDTPHNVVYHMSQFARKAGLPLPDICYLGHRHVNGLTTVDGVKVIESGCIDGMDSYAIDKRLVGSPEQTVTVVTVENPVKALCDIQLNV